MRECHRMHLRLLVDPLERLSTILQGVTTGIWFVGGDREERNILKILVGIRRESGQIIVNYHMRML